MEMIKQVRGWLVMSAWVVCVSGGFVNAARPEQSIKENGPKATATTDPRSPGKPEAAKPNKTVILVKNTNPKTSTVSSAKAKPQAPKEKTTVGRYWKRLMTMVREINHAHRTKK